MALTYKGSQDFRGWLAGNPNMSFDVNDNVFNSAGVLKHAGNDGKGGNDEWSRTAVSKAYKAYQNALAADQAGAANQAGAAGSASYSAASGGSSYVNTDAARNATQQALDSLGNKHNNQIQNNWNDFNNLIGGYDRERNINEGDYKTNDINNGRALQSNKQSTLASSAQGLRGLMNTLGAYGAAQGSGSRLAAQAVNQQANSELGEATDTFSTNKTNLDTAIGRFREEDEARRREAENQRINNERAIAGEVAKERQTLAEKMADLFRQAGNQGQANAWLGNAGALNNEIANNAARRGGYTGKDIAYQAPDLDSIATGTSSRVTMAEDGNNTATANGPSLFYQNQRRREEER